MAPDPSNVPGSGPNDQAADSARLLGDAVELHRRGHLKEAQAIYSSVLEANPEHPDALHLLGLTEIQLNNPQRAADLIGRAVALNPGVAAYHVNRGIALRALKQPAAAAASYTEAIRLNPHHAEAYNNLGNVRRDLGQSNEALAEYEKAIELKPDYAEANHNRGETLLSLGQPEAALASCDRAIRLRPNYAEAHFNRGKALMKLHQFEAAIASYDQAALLRPDHAETFHHRGNALRQLHRHEAAVASCDRAIRIRPDYADAFTDRGTALLALGQPEAGLASHDRAIALNPKSAEAHRNRGQALLALGQRDAALASFDEAIRLQPDDAETYCQRGQALNDLDRPEDALASYDRALVLQPDDAEGYCQRGIIRRELRRFAEAVADFDRAIALNPRFGEAFFQKGGTCLLQGDFARGWELYEWRWERDGTRRVRREFTAPLWSGVETLKNKTILLHGEPGFGDNLQFCRYASLVAAQGARVILEVAQPLFALGEKLEGVSQVVEKGKPLPAFDVHCPLGSLPLAFKTQLATIPAAAGYLRADPQRVEKWAEKLNQDAGRPAGVLEKIAGWARKSGTRKRRVGLVWSGGTGDLRGDRRSLTLSELLPHLPDDFEYVSLQKDSRGVESVAATAGPRIRYFGADLTDFAETAALCELMDLVISVDTSVAHLSGALGKPTWILLPYAADWRWLVDRDDSPWYASARLYRQNGEQRWAGVLERMKADLVRLTRES